MGNYMLAHVLISEAPNRNNRGEDGKVKTISVGGVLRKLVTGDCLKRTMSDARDAKEIRSAEIERYLDLYFEELKDPELSEAEVNFLGENICLCGFGNKHWSKLKKKAPVKDPESDSAAQDDPGRTIVVTHTAQLFAIVEAGLSAFKEFRESEKDMDLFNAAVNGDAEAVGDNGKRLSQPAVKSKRQAIITAMDRRMQQASEEAGVTITEIYKGKMTASGVTGTVASAMRLGDSISIDPLSRVVNTYTAKGVVREDCDPNSPDPKFRALARFAEYVNGKTCADHINTNDRAANTMYRPISVDIGLLYRSVMSKPGLDGSREKLDEILGEETAQWICSLALANPTGGQTTSMSKTRPGILYVEAISHGDEYQLDWTKPVISTTGDVMEQGVKRLLDQITDISFDDNDTVARYVLLRRDLREMYAADFEAAGVKVLNNIGEMRAALAEETVRLGKHL